jgi:hypothetical protein
LIIFDEILAIMDASTINTVFEKIFPTIITLFCTAIVSVTLGVYLEKFKNKLLVLNYKIDIQRVGATFNDNFWGNIEVKHNGRIAKHISFVSIYIYNHTGSDAGKDLNLQLWVDNRSQILGVDSHYAQTGTFINQEGEFQKRFDRLIGDLKEDDELRNQDPNHITPDYLLKELTIMQTNRAFTLPIFNRKSSIKIDLLLENYDGIVPKVSVSILQPSVTLVEEPNKEIEENSKKKLTGLYTSFLYLIFLFAIFINYSNQSVAIIWTIIAGTGSYILGLLSYRFVKLIKSFFSK